MQLSYQVRRVLAVLSCSCQFCHGPLGGPIGAAVFLSLNLSPMGYIASEAVTATVMHIVKTVIYQKYIEIGILEIGVAGAMGIVMVLGTFSGKYIIEKEAKGKPMLSANILRPKPQIP